MSLTLSDIRKLQSSQQLCSIRATYLALASNVAMVKATFLDHLSRGWKRDDWVTRHQSYDSFKRLVLTRGEINNLMTLFGPDELLYGTNTGVMVDPREIIALKLPRAEQLLGGHPPGPGPGTVIRRARPREIRRKNMISQVARESLPEGT